MGFQIAFAFFLWTLQGVNAQFDMTVARDRVIGVLIGNVVSYMVFTRVWPISVARRVDPAISALLRRLSVMTTTSGVSARRSVAAEVLALRDAIEGDLELVAYEPRWTRPQPDWRRLRLEAVQAILALTGPLLLSADRSPTLSVDWVAGCARWRTHRMMPSRHTPSPHMRRTVPKRWWCAHCSTGNFAGWSSRWRCVMRRFDSAPAVLSAAWLAGCADVGHQNGT